MSQENYELKLVESLQKAGLNEYRIKDVMEPMLKVKADIELRKYEIDKKVEAGAFSTETERLNTVLAFTSEFLKDSKLQKFFIATLFAITFLITSGRFFKFITEQLYIQNKVHPAQLKGNN